MIYKRLIIDNSRFYTIYHLHRCIFNLHTHKHTLYEYEIIYAYRYSLISLVFRTERARKRPQENLCHRSSGCASVSYDGDGGGINIVHVFSFLPTTYYYLSAIEYTRRSTRKRRRKRKTFIIIYNICTHCIRRFSKIIISIVCTIIICIIA